MRGEKEIFHIKEKTVSYIYNIHETISLYTQKSNKTSTQKGKIDTAISKTSDKN